MWGWWSPAVVPDLVQKPLGAQGPGDLGPEHLDRDRSIVLEVIGEVHHGHAALPQLALDPVAVAQGAGELLDRHSGSYSWRRPDCFASPAVLPSTGRAGAGDWAKTVGRA